MKKFTGIATGLVACVAMSVIVYAAVVVDENGVGFVGKGDVQNVYGWNNAQLQANAEHVRFRFVAITQAEWECEWWTGPEHNRKYHANNKEVVTELSANIAYDARKNKQGQITGFNLNGFVGEPEVYGDGGEPGDCGGGDGSGNGGNNKRLVEGSLVYGESDGDAVLEVSIDGISWTAFDLPIDD